MQSKPFFELDEISMRADKKLLFRKTSWTFARDQNWALLGPNGSGKTLLARAIAGELPVVEGEIRYNFRPPAGRLPEDCILLVSFEQQKAVSGDAPAAARWFSSEQEAAVTVREFLSQDSVEEINPYNSRDILSDINWTIYRGQSWALTGPNGCRRAAPSRRNYDHLCYTQVY